MTPPTKLDLFQLHRNEYATPRRPVLIQTAPACYLAIAGVGKPGGPVFSACIGGLYSIAFTVKMTRKFAGLQDYGVGKLEGLWFFDQDPSAIPQDQWRWKLLIRTPEFVAQKDLDQAAAALRKKGKPPEFEQVKLERMQEGRVVQVLHVGPYDQERQTVALMAAFAAEKGFKLRGPHHEIYLSDPRRVAPERLRTILRIPVEKAS